MQIILLCLQIRKDGVAGDISTTIRIQSPIVISSKSGNPHITHYFLRNRKTTTPITVIVAIPTAAYSIGILIPGLDCGIGLGVG